jgi:pyridoxamine 5'-phosphate oxidase family protein
MTAQEGSAFTAAELTYLTESAPGRLARIATVGRDGTPHVVPVGWRYDHAQDAIEVGGFRLEATKKFRDVARTGRAALVIDELVSVSPWRPRGIEVRGRAEAVTGGEPVIRLFPERVVSWGIESEEVGVRHSRRV